MRAGLLSREKKSVRGADVVIGTEGNMGKRVIVSAHQSRAVEEPGTYGTSMRENREISWFPVD